MKMSQINVKISDLVGTALELSSIKLNLTRNEYIREILYQHVMEERLEKYVIDRAIKQDNQKQNLKRDSKGKFLKSMSKTKITNNNPFLVDIDELYILKDD